jgi:hypothetical protein
MSTLLEVTQLRLQLGDNLLVQALFYITLLPSAVPKPLSSARLYWSQLLQKSLLIAEGRLKASIKSFLKALVALANQSLVSGQSLSVRYKLPIKHLLLMLLLQVSNPDLQQTDLGSDRCQLLS